MVLIFRHMSNIIFREQVNVPAQLGMLYKAAMTEPRSIAFPRIVKIQMEHLKLSWTMRESRVLEKRFRRAVAHKSPSSCFRKLALDRHYFYYF